MVISCWVKGCKNRADRTKKRGFYTIPIVRNHEGDFTKSLSEDRRQLWLANIKRKDVPSKYSKICSDHFIHGKPCSMYDRSNPDWAPTLLLGESLAPSRSVKKQENTETNKKRVTMDTYLMMLYVSLEQEIALKKFFVDKGWKYRKPELSHFTDEVGPIRLDLPIGNKASKPAPKITSARSKSAASTPSSSSLCTRSKRKHRTVDKEEVLEADDALSMMDGVDDSELNEFMDDDYVDDGDEDDDFVDDDTNEGVRTKSAQTEDTQLAKLDGTIEDIKTRTTSQESSGCDTGKNVSSSAVEATGMDRNLNSTSLRESEESEIPLRYQCGKCLHLFTSRKDLIDHLNENSCIKCKVELDNDRSRCNKEMPDEVEDNGSNISELTDTIDEKSVKVEMNSEDKETVERFKSVDLKKFSFQCNKCDGAYSTMYNLKLHQMSKHHMVFDKPHKCSSCSATCGSAYLLKLHQEHIHKTNLMESFVCDECSVTLYSRKSFISHKKKTHNVIVCFEPDKLHQCDVCGKNFCRKDTMKDHKEIVHLKTRSRKLKMKPTERKFVCDFCGFAFLRQSNLSEHIDCQHKGTANKHTCKDCGKAFQRPYQLEYHKNKVHLKKKLYKCDGCNKDFYTLRNVKQHRDSCLMDDKKKKECTHCGKKYTNQNNLDMHIEAVHSDSPPTCECGVVIKWRSSMAKHKRKCVLYGGKQNKSMVNKLSRQRGSSLNTVKNDLYIAELDADRNIIVSNAPMDLGIDANATLTTNSTDAGGEQVIRSTIANTLRDERLLLDGDMSGTLKVEDPRVTVKNETGTQSVYYVILKE